MTCAEAASIAGSGRVIPPLVMCDAAVVVRASEVSGMSRLHWIDAQTVGRLAITARPRADDWLETEINEWKGSGIDVIVSLLEQEEVSELGLQREAEFCRANGIDFVSFPIPDRGVPESRQQVSEIARFLATSLRNGRSIAIHCRAGIGRSSVIAACTLILCGHEAEQALALIKVSRGLSVPDTDEQRSWVLAFGGR
jgi:protein-tyrosine phosphatase